MFVTKFGDFFRMFQAKLPTFEIFVPIRAETWLTIDHQENVGKKREKRKYEAAQEKAAGTELRRILDQIVSALIGIAHHFLHIFPARRAESEIWTEKRN